MTKMNYSRDIVIKEYNSLSVQFTGEGWFNATTAAKLFKKRPIDWLRRDDIERFVSRLCENHKVSQTHFIKTRKGKGVAGTWLHPRLAVKFTQWLDIDFDIWCSEQIDAIIRGQYQTPKECIERACARLEYPFLTDAIKNEREQQGKEVRFYHFSNEADLINRITLGMTSAKFRAYHDIGKSDPIRDYLTPRQADCVLALQRANTAFIDAGWDFEKRKEHLTMIYNRRHRDALIAETYALEA